MRSRACQTPNQQLGKSRKSPKFALQNPMAVTEGCVLYLRKFRRCARSGARPCSWPCTFAFVIWRASGQVAGSFLKISRYHARQCAWGARECQFGLHGSATRAHGSANWVCTGVPPGRTGVPTPADCAECEETVRFLSGLLHGHRLRPVIIKIPNKYQFIVYKAKNVYKGELNWGFYMYKLTYITSPLATRPNTRKTLKNV